MKKFDFYYLIFNILFWLFWLILSIANYNFINPYLIFLILIYLGFTIFCYCKFIKK